MQAKHAGDVVLPGSADYEMAYRALNARFDDVRPQAVVRCRSAEDVAETVSFARRQGLGIATRGGGHCFAGRSSTREVLLDVTPLHFVEISDGVVTVGGGTRIGEVYDALLEQDLIIPAGSCPTVGIAGLALGGGLGIIGRKYGLTSDHLVGAQIVLADGRILECDDHHDEDLFWALRGAGSGNFGVVTSLTFRTSRAPAPTSFHLTWAFSEAAAVIDAWQSWAPLAPDELAASLVIGASGQADELPLVEVFGVMLGTESDTAKVVDELVGRVPSDPASAFRKYMSFRDTARYWADRAARGGVTGEPPGQELRGYRCIKSEFFTEPLPTDVIEAVLENFLKGRAAGQSRELDFSPWGGAYNRTGADATAFVHRGDLFWLKHATEVDPGASTAEKESARDWVTRSWATVHPWGAGRVFPNFPDPDLEDWPGAYYGTNRDRLQTIKARYDPGNLFRFRQSLPVR
jgi:FAD/FMN-containing dehydrogenase